jgi:DNA (cytosine-5)-methyltransferase 1
MNYGSACSGIEAATVAWEPLGWKPVWFSEIEPFPCKVLRHHYPNVPNLGNMLLLTENETFNNVTIDLLVGGTPCQSFSIAGLRGGLTDDRGNLALQYCRLLYKKRQQGKPIKWFVWENVPGVFSTFSDETNGTDLEGTGPENGRCITETADFATLLEAFRECGYSCAWRVLDAQYFGVPQRRRRVFVVGYFGNDWRPPATVLFEPYSLRGDLAQGGEKEKDIAGTLTARAKGRSAGVDEVAANHVIPCWWDGGQVSQTLDRVLSKGQTMPEKNRFPAVLAYPYNQITSKENLSNPQPGDPCPTITQRDYAPLLIPHVRRLTPVECERLQGFPDNYTLVPGSSDTTRYQSIGNSMAVPVMAWIGKRIDIIDKFLQNGYK